MLDADVKERALMEKIAAGQTIESPDEMTDEYREALINLMTMQADSELAGAYGYVPWISKAPSIEEKLITATIVKDEVRHAKAIYRLLEDLGVDVDSRVAGHDFQYRITDPTADLGVQRRAADKRVNIFYYPIESWTDFVMFNFCMDRGAGHQLEDVLHSSYGPWAREIERIFREELVHVRHGDLWIERLAKDPTTKAETQAALDRWFPRTMNIFGRPGTAKNVLYRKLGLKRRDNGEVRQAFADEVCSKAEPWGLRMPDWQPNW
ncbi:MAG: phenylacetate-CoA oxygenase subunit PaaI [Chloroflexi bacterium]|nr:phenylacetate-CoA oxygenase subunit PaaI [Chloroflexota bacterium]